MAAKNYLWRYLEESGDKVSVDPEKWEKVMQDQKRIEVLNWDTFFDTVLKNLFMVHFSRHDNEVEKLFDPNIGAPLVSLTHKARLAYALGLIDRTLQNDLEQIHRIRNKFAHSDKMDFANEEVLGPVKKLSTAKGKSGPFVAENSYPLYRDALLASMASTEKVVRQEINKVLERARKKKKARKD